MNDHNPTNDHAPPANALDPATKLDPSLIERPWLPLPICELADVRYTSRPHPSLLSDDQLETLCQMNQLRRSGPGGQHRNKVSTAIQWTHRDSGILAEANESRDQHRNRREALLRLRLRLAIRLRSDPQNATFPPPPTTGDGQTADSTNPTDSAHDQEHHYRQLGRQRRLKISPNHRDYPAFLALVMDDLHRAAAQPRWVADIWNASTTAVVTLLAAQPPALEEVNRWRAHHQRGRLHR